MAVRNASARWEGTLKEGAGNVALGSGAFEGRYSFSGRFEDGTGTNPEELIGAGHAGCYSMALNNALFGAGFEPEYVDTTAKVHLTKGDAGMAISQIDLIVEAKIPNIDETKFQEMAADAKDNCIASRALASVPMTVDATLIA